MLIGTLSNWCGAIIMVALSAAVMFGVWHYLDKDNKKDK